LSSDPLPGETVSLWFYDDEEAAWLMLDRGTTDDDGRYDFDVGDFLAPNAAPIFSVLEADGSCTSHRNFLLPSGAQFVVMDIDGTLTIDDDQILMQVADGTYVPETMIGAAALAQGVGCEGLSDRLPDGARQPVRCRDPHLARSARVPAGCGDHRQQHGIRGRLQDRVARADDRETSAGSPSRRTATRTPTSPRTRTLRSPSTARSSSAPTRGTAARSRFRTATTRSTSPRSSPRNPTTSACASGPAGRSRP
jgi:hypothetical protein